jgi:hypothetical protein
MKKRKPAVNLQCKLSANMGQIVRANGALI